MAKIARHAIVQVAFVVGALLIMAGIVKLAVAHANSLKANTIRITAFNPYRLDVRLEVKCDHDWKTNRFVFHKFIDVPGKQDTVIYVPNNMKDCQIWPKIIW